MYLITLAIPFSWRTTDNMHIKHFISYNNIFLLNTLLSHLVAYRTAMIVWLIILTLSNFQLFLNVISIFPTYKSCLKNSQNFYLYYFHCCFISLSFFHVFFPQHVLRTRKQISWRLLLLRIKHLLPVIQGMGLLHDRKMFLMYLHCMTEKKMQVVVCYDWQPKVLFYTSDDWWSTWM